MPSKQIRIVVLIALSVLLQLSTDDCYAQSKKEQRRARKEAKEQPLQIPSLTGEGFTVKGGQRFFDSQMDSLKNSRRDSLMTRYGQAMLDSLGQNPAVGIQDSLMVIRTPVTVTDSDGTRHEGEFVDTVARDSTFMEAEMLDRERLMTLEGKINAVNDEDGEADTLNMSKRERRRYDRMLARLDTMNYRHHPMFRDTMKMGTSFAISLAVPGFQQFYNQQYWKIPVLYGTLGAALYFGIKESRVHKVYKRDYDYLRSIDANWDDIEPVQRKMMRHNTNRTLLLLGALGSYIYFLGDGLLNYPSETKDPVQTATLLSTICPGAGQIYNESYWRAPVFWGLGATTIYVISFNNRIYQRYKLAYQYRTDGNDATVDEFEGRLDEKQLLNYKQSYRRSRDLAIILTGLVYLFNIMDAHVDAHLKDFDVSDDLSYKVKLDPVFTPVYTQTRGVNAMVGLNLTISF